MLNEFVRDAALPYLEHENTEVRKEAVLASTQLFVNDPIVNQSSSHSIEIISDVLEKLLSVGITDPSTSLSRHTPQLTRRSTNPSNGARTSR